ncbi:hypothetical protein [Pseudomonas peli]|uniref:hypothetical protein n=1 Tax=Pseudomonas peli TaxID=592361 RepID=UPI00285CCC01|nr:hypothetical protein [Pseudomonas peli]MDR7024168.1 hypothetical protein [Pseudomonas peli]
MANVFKRSSVVQAWLAGARYLAEQKSLDATNIILEIETPQKASLADRDVISTVTAALKSKNAKRSVMTAAGTIFPNTTYKHYGRPGWYEIYKSLIKRGKPKSDWGTYALRMIQRTDATGTIYNPLDKIIEKLKSRKAPNQKAFKAAYELGVSDPSVDICAFDNGFGFDLPTYNPDTDRGDYMGLPCLSHVTFKLMDGKVDLTAIYRAHYYAERALGNLIGLAQLQNYVAIEAGYEPGVLTCISTYAKLDEGLGGITGARRLLNKLPEDEAATEGFSAKKS